LAALATMNGRVEEVHSRGKKKRQETSRANKVSPETIETEVAT